MGNPLLNVLLSLTAFSAVAYVVFIALFFRGARRAVRHDAAVTPGLAKRARPPVTILKPCAGSDDDLEACLESFCRLNYPRYQLVFGVRDASDPAGAVLEALRARHPERDIEIVLSAAGLSPNPKVANLEVMVTRAKHAILWVSDSNTLVHPDTLAAMVDDLEQPGVGIVVSPVTGIGERTAGAALENLQLSAWATMFSFAIYAMCGRMTAPGKSALFRRASLEAIGGFAELGRYCAEDYILVEKFRARGERSVLGRHLVANVNRTGTVRRFLARHLRWGQMRWLVATSTAFFEPLESPMIPGLVALLVAPSALTLAVCAGACALQCAGDVAVHARLRGHGLALAWLPLVWLRPLCQVWLWARSSITRRVVWRGNVRWIGADSAILDESPAQVRLRTFRRVVTRRRTVSAVLPSGTHRVERDSMAGLS